MSRRAVIRVMRDCKPFRTVIFGRSRGGLVAAYGAAGTSPAGVVLDSTARLLALGNPTLLRVEVDGGHGVEATRAQRTSMYVDFFTFVFWRSGESGWQPGR